MTRPTPHHRPLGPTARLRAAWGMHPPTGVLVAVMLGLLALFAVGLVLDDRVVTGAPVWLKPMKFAISIALYSVTILWMLSLLLTTRFATPSLRWALRLGATIAVVGMAQAFLMTSPTAQQMADWKAGEPVTVVSAHAVGVRDGGPGLPLLRPDALTLGTLGALLLLTLAGAAWSLRRFRPGPWRATRRRRAHHSPRARILACRHGPASAEPRRRRSHTT